MTREEMLHELNRTNIAAELTFLPSEMALECTCVTTKGYKYEWMSLDEWPASVILFYDQKMFHSIKDKILNQNFGISDIKETALYSLYADLATEGNPNQTKESLCELFCKLTKLDYPDDGKIYILHSAKNKIEFFSDYKQFEVAFCKEYATDIIPWDTLSDKELEEWIERTRSEFDGIPCSEYEV